MREKVTDFFRDLYEKEHATKQRINANLPFWLTLYSMQIGISVYYLRILEKPYYESWHLSFYLPFALAWYFIVRSIISTVVCFKGHDYAFLGKPNELFAYYSQGRAVAENKNDFDSSFLENIESQYAETADFNREVNRKRLETNLHAMKNIFIGISILILAFPANLIIKANSPPNEEKIKITNPINIKMSEEKEKPTQPSEPINQGPAPKDQPATPAPMEFPKPDFLRESIANARREKPSDPIDIPTPPKKNKE